MISLITSLNLVTPKPEESPTSSVFGEINLGEDHLLNVPQDVQTTDYADNSPLPEDVRTVAGMDQHMN